MKYSELMFDKLRSIGWSFNDEDKENFLQVEYLTIENAWDKYIEDDTYQLNENEWEIVGFVTDLLKVLIKEEL